MFAPFSYIGRFYGVVKYMDSVLVCVLDAELCRNLVHLFSGLELVEVSDWRVLDGTFEEVVGPSPMDCDVKLPLGIDVLEHGGFDRQEFKV